VALSGCLSLLGSFPIWQIPWGLPSWENHGLAIPAIPFTVSSSYRFGRSVGYLMIIYIAALQSIPKSLTEAASIDGASKLQTIWHVIRPLIMNSITIGIFVSLSASFKVFDQVYALTGGGPGTQTQVVSLNIFNEAFYLHRRFGYASAKAVVLFVIILLITGVQLIVMKRREVEH